MTSFDEASMTSGYARYLAAKTTVDDRALNRHVLAELRRLMPAGAPQVLEVGAGLGTMVARLMDWGAVGAGEYLLLDARGLGCLASVVARPLVKRVSVLARSRLCGRRALRGRHCGSLRHAVGDCLGRSDHPFIGRSRRTHHEKRVTVAGPLIPPVVHTANVVGPEAWRFWRDHTSALSRACFASNAVRLVQHASQYGRRQTRKMNRVT